MERKNLIEEARCYVDNAHKTLIPNHQRYYRPLRAATGELKVCIFFTAKKVIEKTHNMKKLLIFAKIKELMELGQRVNISPYLTHLSDWVSGEIIEIEDNPYRGTVISAKDDMGRIFWGEADYFTQAI